MHRYLLLNIAVTRFRTFSFQCVSICMLLADLFVSAAIDFEDPRVFCRLFSLPRPGAM
jgi:hypothetical protein